MTSRQIGYVRRRCESRGGYEPAALLKEHLSFACGVKTAFFNHTMSVLEKSMKFNSAPQSLDARRRGPLLLVLWDATCLLHSSGEILLPRKNVCWPFCSRMLRPLKKPSAVKNLLSMDPAMLCRSWQSCYPIHNYLRGHGSLWK